MDSPQISDSTPESQYELKKAEKIEYSSVCSTDDELNLQLSPQSDASFPRNASRPSVKKSTITFAQEQQQQQGDIIQQQPAMPRTIFGFLERKIELNNAKNANNNNLNNQNAVINMNKKNSEKQQQVTNCIYFNLKEHEFVSEEEDDSDIERSTSSNMNSGQKIANQGNHQKSGQKKFVVYQIEAIEEKRKGNRIIGKESWTFSSRYSMLLELYESLKREISNFSSLNLPKFPGKKWFGNMDEQFLAERKRDLQIFFKALSQCKAAMQSKTIQELLNESREAADEEFSL